MTGTMAWLMTFATIAAAAEKPVTVYLTDHTNVDSHVKSNAKARAKRIFAASGIGIRWRDGRPSHANPHADDAGHSILIEIKHSAPSLDLATARAMAVAMMKEGNRIEVFWNRIRFHANPESVLAYVLVHELTHILQGVPRHSAGGIMKSNWNRMDFAAMAPNAASFGLRPLLFESVDLELLRNGLAARGSLEPAGVVQTSARMGRKLGE